MATTLVEKAVVMVVAMIGERRQRKFNDKNDRTFNERSRRDRQR